MNNTFSFYLENIGEFGIVTQITPPIVLVEGLPNARPQEIVVFENGQYGEIFSLNKDNVEVLTFSRDSIPTNSRVARTNKSLAVPVGKELLGKIIDPLGLPLFSPSGFVRPKEERTIDTTPLGFTYRERIKRAFHTGVTLVDIMVPIGKGQKELIIGDRKTGKSSFLLTAIRRQLEEGSVAIYAAIGRKKSDIVKLKEYFDKEGLSKQMVIVATSSYDSPSLIYLTPYTAMSIAEYFRDNGTDVFLVLDDLSTHAAFYRELSLIAKRFPGRDSYPGDIFHIHAKLLERAGNFKHSQKGEVAITCFPVVESIEGDFTSYLVTNLMGVTDGHIYFDNNAFYRGRRPAINISLSVTRVGRQTQPNVKRTITRELTSFLSLYDKMQTFSHFGAELTETVKNVLRNGDRIYSFFDQPYEVTVPEEVQLILFTLLWTKLIDTDNPDVIASYRASLSKAYNKDPQAKEFFETLTKADTFNDLIANVMKHKDQIFTICKKNTV